MTSPSNGRTVAAAVTAFAAASLWAAAPVAAQTVTGQLGSPGATTTIQGNQIPPPPKFGGVIKESAKDSKTWWPPRVVPPKGAPNVLLIGRQEDQGLSQILTTRSTP